MTKHYTPGRTAKISKIVLHHNAGNLTVQGCWDVWQTRQASAHYQVQRDGLIGQLVKTTDTAWHATTANPSSIGIEHANATMAPGWTISDATLEAGAHLVAALCKHHGLGRPAWKVNVFPHSAFNSTACPGAIQGSQNQAYMTRAAYWYDQMTKTTQATPTPAPPPPVAGPTAAAKTRPVLRQGATGVMVRELQQRLIARGFTCGPSGADGKLGTATRSAVKAFQKARHLKVDGIAGPQTWTALGV